MHALIPTLDVTLLCAHTFKEQECEEEKKFGLQKSQALTYHRVKSGAPKKDHAIHARKA